jgi:Tc toxin complex TcA C-terminal TcB-binding domain
MALKVTQLSNRIRIDKKPGTQYAEVLTGDDRFKYNVAVGQSIETSRGEEDSVLFSQNLDDERYLPFEGSGLIGQYQIELPTELINFDYNTISEVMFHTRYTARDGGCSFKDRVNDALVEQLSELKASVKTENNGLFLAINLRRDRPDV